MSGWLVEMLVWTGVLMGAVLVLRRPVARLFGAQAAYALWLAPALRAVMPPLPQAPAAVTPAVTAASPSYSLIEAAAERASALPLGSILLAVWIAGALLFLALHWIRHHCFLADALAHGRALSIDTIDEDVVASSRVDGPMATGLIHPLTLVPDDFADRFSPEEQRLALLHEHLHHRRGDIWASAAALLLASLHWFNPIAHVALAAFRRDMEAACDASVLARTGPDAAPDYAATILRCASRPVPRSLCALTSIDELKGRLTMLTFNHGPLRRMAGLAVAGAFAAGALATASAAQEQQPETKMFEKKIILRGAPSEKDVLMRGGPGELKELNCPGEKFVADATSGDRNRKGEVRFMLCAKTGESLLAALQKAETDVQKQDEMPAATKAEILKQIRAKIAELRAKG